MQLLLIPAHQQYAPGHRAAATERDGKNPAAQFDAPAQLALDTKILSGQAKRKDLVGEIAKAVIAYNTGIKSKSSKDKINELHVIEHEIYRWFDENKTKDLYETNFGPALKTLMSNIQSEHQLLVGASLNEKDAEPPVANFDTLDPSVQQKIRQTWQSLVNGSGNIQIEQTQTYTSTEDQTQKTKQHKGFRVQVLASFARLLSTAFGRQLVAEANANTNGQNLVTIRPGLSVAKDDIPEDEFVATANTMDGQLEELDLAKWFGQSKKGSKAYNKKLKQLNLKYPEEKDISKKFGEKRNLRGTHNLKKKGNALGFRVHDGQKMRYYTFGKGTGSSITMTSDVKDGSGGAMSRFVDEDGNEIVVPVFITLGHELGHALHAIRGAQTGHYMAQSFDPIVAGGINIGEYSGTLEEVVTIRGVENTLRDEHGITTRHSHHNALSLKSQEIRNGPLSEAQDAKDKLPEPFRTQIKDMLDDISTLLSQRKMKQAEAKLRKAQKKITEVQQQLLVLQNEPEPEEENTGFWAGFFRALTYLDNG